MAVEDCDEEKDGVEDRVQTIDKLHYPVEWVPPLRTKDTHNQEND